MSRKRLSVEQIIDLLREAEILLAQGRTVGEICRRIRLSEQSCLWMALPMQVDLALSVLVSCKHLSGGAILAGPAQMGHTRAQASVTGRPQGPRYESGSLRAGPTCCAELRVGSQAMRGSSSSSMVSSPVRRVAQIIRAYFFDDGNRSAVIAAPLMKLIDPLVDGIRLVPGRAHYGTAAVANRVFRCWLPRFEMPSRTRSFPLECCLGTRQSQAAMWWQFLVK